MDVDVTALIPMAPIGGQRQRRVQRIEDIPGHSRSSEPADRVIRCGSVLHEHEEALYKRNVIRCADLTDGIMKVRSTATDRRRPGLPVGAGVPRCEPGISHVSVVHADEVFVGERLNATSVLAAVAGAVDAAEGYSGPDSMWLLITSFGVDLLRELLTLLQVIIHTEDMSPYSVSLARRRASSSSWRGRSRPVRRACCSRGPNADRYR